MRFRSAHNLIFDLIIVLAVILTAVEGFILILQVMETDWSAEVAAYDKQLDNMMAWLSPEEYSSEEIFDVYGQLMSPSGRIPGRYNNCAILDENKQTVIGSDLHYSHISSLKIYSPETDYFERNHMTSLFSKLFSSGSYFVSEDGTVSIPANRLSSWMDVIYDTSMDLVMDDVIYYEKEYTTADGKNYAVLIGRDLTISGQTARQSFLIFTIDLFINLIIGVIVFCITCSSIREYNKIFDIAYYDSITKLRNRSKFELDATRLVRKRKQTQYAVVCLDIRKFKVIMEYYGKEYANDILKQISNCLQEHIQAKELCAKDKNDIFLMLLGYQDQDELKERLKKLNFDLELTFIEQKLQFAFGVYCIQDYQKDWKRLINYAYLAKEAVKESIGESIVFMDETSKEQMRRERELENEMESAIENKEIVVYLQPKYSTDGTMIGGAEALARWISPKLGFVSPGEFIKLFEKNGFIVNLDHYMLEAICQQQRKWMDEGKQLITISVNISRVHLMKTDMVEDIIRTVDKYGIPHDCIELEITESAFFDDKNVMINTIEQLQSAGFCVSMDDFGAGYSSLNSLKDLPLNVIKLDGEFFQESNNEDRSRTIVRDTIDMAKDLEMKIVAEGVEKEEQVDFLDKMGCDLIQGFYFAKPMPVSEFEYSLYEKTDNVS